MDISVVIPVYNVKDYLKKAVKSLENQKIAKMEIILVDDGSKDGTDDGIPIYPLRHKILPH